MQKIVLFVDDEPALRELLPLWLGRYGYRVLTAASAEVALVLLQAEHVHIVLTDLNLPGLSGLQLLERVQEVPAILLASGMEEIAAEEKHRLRISAVLSKPIQRELLLTALREATT